MATVPATLQMFNGTAGSLQIINRSMDLLVSKMYQMESAAGQNVAKTKMLMATTQKMSLAETELKLSIEQATAAQTKFGQSVKSSKSGAEKLLGTVKSVGAISLKLAQKGMDIVDSYTASQNRLGLISGGDTKGLQNSVFAAATRSRTDYGTTADTVTNLGLLAKDKFSNTNDEIVSFTELMQKSFKLGSGSTEEQKSGMDQVTKAMASGKLEGDGFKAILASAPRMAQAITEYTGKSTEELLKMADSGGIGAQILKNSLFGAAKDINEKFGELPMSFADVMTDMKNRALQAFGPVMEKISQLLDSPAGRAFVSNIGNAISIVAVAINALLDGLAWIGQVVHQNWGIIETVLVTIGSALTLWSTTQIPNLIKKLQVMVKNLWDMVKPIAAAALKFLMLNWPILLIGAAIGFLIYAMINFGDQVVKVVGFVGGIFGVLFALLYNKFAFFSNIVLSIAEFFMNVWHDPIYAVKKLFYDLVINALQFMGNLAKGIENIINKIPGLHVEITGGMDNLLNKLQKDRDNLKSEKDVVTLMRHKQIDYGDAFNKGQDIGKIAGQWTVDKVQGIAGTIGDKVNSLFGGGKSGEPGTGIYPNPDPYKGSNIDKVGEVGKIGSTVDISSEDLKIMRELAEMKNIQNFVSLTPSVNVTTGDVRSESDIDTIISRIKNYMEVELVSSAQGVHS